MDPLKIFAIAVFLIMYILMIVLPKGRAVIALCAAAAMVIGKVLPIGKHRRLPVRLVCLGTCIIPIPF